MMAGGLDMSTADMAYENLVGHVAATPACGTRIRAGEPDASLLVAKVEGTQDEHVCGHRMPALGSTLSTGQIASIRQWITDGAMR